MPARGTRQSVFPARLLAAAFRSLVSWAIIGLLTWLVTASMTVCAFVLWPVDTKRTCPHWLATLWGRAVFACHPSWPVTVTGREHLDPRQPSILIANHQSQLDIMALYHVRHQFKWVVKASLFDIPFLGWGMSGAGYIKLARGRYASVRQTYDRAKEWLAQGMSVFFFPEGTRSQGSQPGPFKDGAFRLALETGVPVVPIAITGTRGLLKRGSWLFHRRAHVQIAILPPLDPTRYREAGPDRFKEDARALIEQTLHALKRSAVPGSTRSAAPSRRKP